MPTCLYMLFCSLAFAGLISCDYSAKNKPSAEENPAPATSSSLTRQEIPDLLAFYEPQDSFPVKVSTKVGEWEGPESPKFLWRGQPIPESYWPLFRSVVNFQPHLGEESVFANVRFAVDAQTQALLTRLPGEYWASQVYLFLFDTRSGRMAGAYRMAESWADAGDSFYLESEIHRVGPGLFRLEIRQGECHPVDETYRKFTCADSLTITLLQHGQFRRLSKKPIPKV